MFFENALILDDAVCEHDVMKQNNEKKETEYRVHRYYRVVQLHHPDCCTLNSEVVSSPISFYFITSQKERP